jgi:hypothetical protein
MYQATTSFDHVPVTPFDELEVTCVHGENERLVAQVRLDETKGVFLDCASLPESTRHVWLEIDTIDGAPPLRILGCVTLREEGGRCYVKNKFLFPDHAARLETLAALSV